MNCCENVDVKEEYQTFKNGTKHLRQSCRSCNKFLGFKQQPISLDYELPFGKHKGKRLKDIDRDYLIWLSKQPIKDNLSTAINSITFM